MSPKTQNAALPRRPSRRAGQKGYLLLAVMLLIAVMLIGMGIEAQRISQQIKREKEEELVHRGKEYATAIKKFYHKNGTYPLSLDQLESTNNQRFLRQRFKDPMTESGEWKLIHVGEAQITIPTAPAGTPGAPGQTGTLNTSPMGGAATASPTPGGFGSPGGLSSGFNPGGLPTGNQPGAGMPGAGMPGAGVPGAGVPGAGVPGAGGPGAGGPGAGGQMGTLNTQSIGTGSNGSQGGGPIIGVASTSKKTSIKEFAGAHEYDQWLFVYDPRLEQAPGSNGVMVATAATANAPSSSVPAGVVQGAPATQPSPGNPPAAPAVTPTPQAVPQ